MNLIPYSSTSIIQQVFLDALALGETSAALNCYVLGVGGKDLSKCPRHENGFPIWDGLNNSHAAGRYQFEPKTWAVLSSHYNLNWSNPVDQDKGAWMLAQEDYYGRCRENLCSDLNCHLFMRIQTYLQATWPSVNGNGANPHGLAWLLARNSDGKW